VSCYTPGVETPSDPTEEQPQPTAHDHENERLRRAVAERIEADYMECWERAVEAFGPGWTPACRHYLVDKAEEEKHRRTGEKAVIVATVFTVKNAKGDRRHFTVAEDGTVTEHASYETGFGTLLLEPHPTRTIEVRGQMVHPHRYSLCWAGYELYTPKTAEDLARLRASRERKKAERADQAWAEANPLLASIGLTRTD
jgi:hypothetical protein